MRRQSRANASIRLAAMNLDGQSADAVAVPSCAIGDDWAMNGLPMILAPRHQMVHFRAAACANGDLLSIAYLHAHDPAPPSGRPPATRLSSTARPSSSAPIPVDPAGSEIQLSSRIGCRSAPSAVLHQAIAVRPRRGGRDQADASGDHLRQVGELLPPEILPALQEPTSRSPRRSHPAIPAHARDRPRLRMIPVEQDRYEADDLIATYARQAREKGADVLIISADKDLDAADRAGRLHVRSSVRRGGRKRLARGAAHRRRGSDRIFRRGPRKGDRHSGARRRFDRQCARRSAA